MMNLRKMAQACWHQGLSSEPSDILTMKTTSSPMDTKLPIDFLTSRIVRCLTKATTTITTTTKTQK
jgi:hypothetical protein